jgi:hypothetical protein
MTHLRVRRTWSSVWIAFDSTLKSSRYVPVGYLEQFRAEFALSDGFLPMKIEPCLSYDLDIETKLFRVRVVDHDAVLVSERVEEVWTNILYPLLGKGSAPFRIQFDVDPDEVDMWIPKDCRTAAVVRVPEVGFMRWDAGQETATILQPLAGARHRFSQYDPRGYVYVIEQETEKVFNWKMCTVDRQPSRFTCKIETQKPMSVSEITPGPYQDSCVVWMREAKGEGMGLHHIRWNADSKQCSTELLDTSELEPALEGLDVASVALSPSRGEFLLLLWPSDAEAETVSLLMVVTLHHLKGLRFALRPSSWYELNGLGLTNKREPRVVFQS